MPPAEFIRFPPPRGDKSGATQVLCRFAGRQPIVVQFAFVAASYRRPGRLPQSSNAERFVLRCPRPSGTLTVIASSFAFLIHPDGTLTQLDRIVGEDGTLYVNVPRGNASAHLCAAVALWDTSREYPKARDEKPDAAESTATVQFNSESIQIEVVKDVNEDSPK